MTAPNDPPAATPETTVEKPSTKPARTPPTPEQVGRQLARLDGLAIALLLVLAFFLGSYAARNTDLWMHLATGRLLAQGGYSFGVDPFSYTATSSWINHAWLFDLLLYGLSVAAGGIETPTAGTVLVGFKALLVTALAWVLLQIRRPGLSLWPPIFCTLLALLAMSHWLELRPQIVSLLFLAITLCVLVAARTPAITVQPVKARGSRAPTPPLASSPFRLWLLVPLCALWANLDSWFLLGPLTVGLFLLGEGFQQAFDPGRFGNDKLQPGELRRLFQIFLACVVASLLNPHHLSGFALPAEWAWGTRDALQQSDVSVLRSYSPWELDYFRFAAPVRSVAGLAYYPLVLLSLLSFILNQKGWRWSRVFLWVFFILFSFWQVSLTGFSAVVLAPLAALNLQDYALRRLGAAPATDVAGRAWALGGRALTLLFVVVLLAGAWPGWLHALPTDLRHPHRVAWRVEIEPSLREAAQQFATWREEKRWTDEQNGFLFHPDVAHYCAWFAPAEKGFLDHRHVLFSGVAAEFMKVRQALRGPAGKPAGVDFRAQQQALDTAYANIFAERRVRHVVLYFNENDDEPRQQDTQRQSIGYRVLQWLLLQPERWAPVYLKGRTVVFEWHEPRLAVIPADPVRAGHMDLKQRAFGHNLPEHERAPAACPPWPNQRRSIWDRYFQAEQPAAADLNESTRWREYSQHVSQLTPFIYDGAQKFAAFTSPALASGTAPGSLLMPAALNWATRLGPVTLNWEGVGQPAALFLALRATRRAIAANPESARSYQELAAVCETLWQQQEAPWNGGRFDSPLRKLQVLGAFRQLVTLRPDLHRFQFDLGELYLRMGYTDLAAEHFREGLTLERKAGPRAVPTDQFLKAMDAKEKQISQLEAELKNARGKYLVASQGQPPLARAQMARDGNLTKEALQILMQPDGRERSPGEIALLLELLFATGQLHEASELLQPRLKAILGPGYDVQMTLLSAVLGNYKEATGYLDGLLAGASKARQESFPDMLQAGTFLARLNNLPGGRVTGIVLALEGRRLPKLGQLLQAPFRFQDALSEEAALHFLRGTLALEEGDNDAAERHLQAAIGLSGAGRIFDGLPIARRYLKLLQEARR